METVESKFTVFFDEPFWIGIYERNSGGNYEVCKVVFGAEPKDYEVYEKLLKNWNRLKFGKSVKEVSDEKKKINPKRMHRKIQKSLQNKGIGTKAQQALKRQHEVCKLERKTVSKEMKEAEKQRQFDLHIEKKKEKHRGH